MPSSIGGRSGPLSVVPAPPKPADNSAWRTGLPTGEVDLKLTLRPYGYTHRMPDDPFANYYATGSTHPPPDGATRDAFSSYEFSLKGQNPGKLTLSLELDGKPVDLGFNEADGSFSMMGGPEGYLSGLNLVVRGDNRAAFTTAAGGVSGTLAPRTVELSAAARGDAQVLDALKAADTFSGAPDGRTSLREYQAARGHGPALTPAQDLTLQKHLAEVAPGGASPSYAGWQLALPAGSLHHGADFVRLGGSTDGAVRVEGENPGAVTVRFATLDRGVRRWEPQAATVQPDGSFDVPGGVRGRFLDDGRLELSGLAGQPLREPRTVSLARELPPNGWRESLPAGAFEGKSHFRVWDAAANVGRANGQVTALLNVQFSGTANGDVRVFGVGNFSSPEGARVEADGSFKLSSPGGTVQGRFVNGRVTLEAYPGVDRAQVDWGLMELQR